MSANSSIEWTDATWNPIRARYSEGFNKRLGTGLPFKPGHRKDIEIFLDHEMLTAPLRWKKPRLIFVCSMTDLFADFVPDEWIDKMFAVMALCPQHTFQVLTKRAERMCGCLRDVAASAIGAGGLPFRVADQMPLVARAPQIERALNITLRQVLALFPLPNVWLGVSCERQEEADARIPLLLQTPAAVRFISAEPLLGPIDLRPKADDAYQKLSEWYGPKGFDPTGSQPRRERISHLLPKLDWVIAGGESGRQARPMHPQWACDLRDQCQASGVPFFFKQWGEWYPGVTCGGPRAPVVDLGDIGMFRVGKKAAGRLLDGREWNEFPALRP